MINHGFLAAHVFIVITQLLKIFCILCLNLGVKLPGSVLPQIGKSLLQLIVKNLIYLW